MSMNGDHSFRDIAGDFAQKFFHITIEEAEKGTQSKKPPAVDNPRIFTRAMKDECWRRVFISVRLKFSLDRHLMFLVESPIAGSWMQLEMLSIILCGVVRAAFATSTTI